MVYIYCLLYYLIYKRNEKFQLKHEKLFNYLIITTYKILVFIYMNYYDIINVIVYYNSLFVYIIYLKNKIILLRIKLSKWNA